MKFDMHCHTHEGSLDGKIPVDEYIQILMDKGYGGMLVTDHDSYNGFRAYRDFYKERFDDFVVLKGIEYDTIDAGHILVIMPSNVKLLILECRGLPVKILQDIVHKHGGILGPAHPCGERHLSITRTRAYKKNHDIMRGFDFVEAFNACEAPDANAQARGLALEYGLPMFGGSDSHHPECVGTAYTELPETVRNEDSLISIVKAKQNINYGGTYYHGTVRSKIGVFNHVLVESFWFYNKFASLYRYHKRKVALALLK